MFYPQVKIPAPPFPSVTNLDYKGITTYVILSIIIL